jgi:hypothetical protein
VGHKRKFNRNRKRSERRHDRPSRPRDWSAPPLNESEGGFDADDFGFLLDAALTNSGPAAFVGYVSSTLAIVDDHGVGSNSMHEFIERVGDDKTQNGHALLIGIAAMAPRADDRTHAERLLADRSQADRDCLPGWITGIEQAVAVNAFAHQDLWWDSSFVTIELQLGDHPLCVFADIGHVDRYIVTKGHLYPGTVDSFLDEFPEVTMTAGTSTDYVDIGRAGAQLVEAVRRSDEIDMSEAFFDDMWRPMRAEILWAARLAGATSFFRPPKPNNHGIDPLFDPETIELTETEVAAVVNEFRSSPHGQRANVDGADKGIELIVSYATTVGHGRLESWGPRRAALFLHSYVLGEIWEGDFDLLTVPRLLEHWIHFINERAEMPASMAQETIERVHDVTPIYNALLRARDQSVRDTADDLVAGRFRK